MFAGIFIQQLPADVSLVDFSYGFSPLVEQTSANTAVMDVDGCELLFGSAYGLANQIAQRAVQVKGSGGIGCKINVALAANPDTAIHGAKFLNGVSFIAPGEELTALGHLPVHSLCFDLVGLDDKKQAGVEGFQEIVETLKLWGVHTFREF